MIRNDIYYVRARLPSFVRNRAVLLGDAAHAVTPDIGQGACLALEDATVLAAELADGSDIDSALASYDRVRRPRTERMARTSGRVGRILQARTPVTAGLRDLVGRLMPAKAYLRAGAGAMAWKPPPTRGLHR